MAAASTIALITGLALAAGTSAYQVKKSADDGKIARDEASEQKGAQDKLINEAKDRQLGERAKAEGDAVRLAQRTKQRQANVLFGGGSAPAGGAALGGQVPTPPAGKTLLGM
jgi:hypothetical protein